LLQETANLKTLSKS